jgi:hypothetical protein
MGGWTGIAQLTLKPKPKTHVEQRSADEMNELQLDSK